MPKKENFNFQGFSLVLTTSKGKSQTVNIPKSKRGFQNSIVGGKSTYQMAIDAYTVMFKDKNELLNDIRKNGYARIKTIKNNDIIITINYNGRVATNKIVYSDKESIKEFIRNNPIGSSFGFIGTVSETYTYNVIKKFKEKVIEMFFNNEFCDYYYRYLKKNQIISKTNLLTALNQGYDESIYQNTGQFKLLNEIPFYEYENIRNHLLTNYESLELEFAVQRYEEAPFNEKVEARKDYQEAIEEIHEKYKEKKESPEPKPNIIFKNLKGPYTIDPEEQMEKLNNPDYEESFEEELEYDEYDYLADYIDYLDPNREVVPYEQLGEFNYFDESNKPPIIIQESVKKRK